MRTRNLETLRRDAASACKWRGHSMRWTKPAKYDNGQCQDGVCRKCGADVRVKRIPMPNECWIMGDAVALECKPRDKETK